MRFARAQAAVEFMICVMVLVFVMIIFTIYAGSKNTEAVSADSKLEADAICWQMSDLINTAMYSKGYYAEFTLPITIKGSYYNLTVSNSTVEADYRGHSCIYEIAVTNISFRGMNTPFKLCGGHFNISNNDNSLVINNYGIVGC